MSSSCVFCKIVRREIPSHVVHDDADCFAFLDLHPIREGHALVIPKAHVDHFSDLPDDLAAKIMVVGQRLSRHLHAAVAPKRVGLLVAGFSVPHAHLHVVPLHHPHDLTSQAYAPPGVGPIAYDIANIPAAAPATLAGLAERLRNQA